MPLQRAAKCCGSGLGTLSVLKISRALSSGSTASNSASGSSAALLQAQVVGRGDKKAGEESSRWRFSTIFLFLPCLATFGLGTWQLIRRQKKIEMLDYRRTRLEEEPLPLTRVTDGAKTRSDSDGDSADGLEYRKVICEGVYDKNKSLYVGPRARSDFGVTQKGYYLITPLITGRGDQRGWVPSGYKDEIPEKRENTSANDETGGMGSSKVEQGSWWTPWSWGSKSTNKDVVATPEHEAKVKVCGVIRGSEQPNMFVPPNAPESGQWFYVDVPSMARAVGLPENALLIEAVEDKDNNTATGKYPIPKNPEALLHASVMPQDHINYALTWYTLSAATTYMAVKRVRNARRGF
ncbi:hypothetical protein R1sor_010726 [Riccia sorocarpa]|uniref:SURF1-like protein n=1 Tax=Riccia sorocarpa TaxID=122646 RepID=A0ABD3I2R0_9MARC